QEEGAEKEVKIAQITKQRAQNKQDLQGLNIALDSKQELELCLKHRMGVRGTGGATPAQPSKVAARRDSAVFSTPGVTSRPPSGLSNAGTDGGSSSRAKMAAIGKSMRLNGSAAKPSAASHQVRCVLRRLDHHAQGPVISYFVLSKGPRSPAHAGKRSASGKRPMRRRCTCIQSE
ncbi:hypothetical protein B0H11DRAFT_1729301, partial [Mycena galericulata]